MAEQQKGDSSDTLEEMGRDIAHAFTIERDTSLAEGAGAPGSTYVGGTGREGEAAPHEHDDAGRDRRRRDE
jgi:hypothetical protein